MDWIHVDEACPAEGDVVLASDRHGAYFVATYFKRRWETVEMKPIDVSYWMEIPSLPNTADSIDDLFDEELMLVKVAR